MTSRGPAHSILWTLPRAVSFSPCYEAKKIAHKPAGRGIENEYVAAERQSFESTRCNDVRIA